MYPEITDYKNKHQGETCFVLGNGPSLNDVDLDRLSHPTFGTNRIYLSGFTPTYHVAVNPLVTGQFGEEIDQLDCVKFRSDKNLDTTLNHPNFSSPEGPLWEGFTVTYVCLQLAYYMGFERVILLGVDHDYGKHYRPNLELIATGADEGHFDPGYFSGGVRWNAPDLQMSEIAYSIARAHYEKAGREIINCSTRTKLDVFDIQPLNYVLHRQHARLRVSAVVSAYKAERFIEGCLDDLALQTEKPEVIVVCQEGSAEHDAALATTHKIVTTKDIPTVYRAWNLGIQAATGKYVTNANTDDRHHPDAYRIMADVLDGNPGIDVVYHDSFVSWKPNQDYRAFTEENQETKLVSGRHVGQPGIFYWRDYEKSALVDGCFLGPHPMWRANLHQRFGGFVEQYKSAGDYEFWLRIAGDRNMLRIPLPLGVYHANPNGVELSDLALNAEEARAAINLHQSPQVEIRPVGPDTYRVALDGVYTFVEHDPFHNLVDRLKEMR